MAIGSSVRGALNTYSGPQQTTARPSSGRVSEEEETTVNVPGYGEVTKEDYAAALLKERWGATDDEVSGLTNAGEPSLADRLLEDVQGTREETDALLKRGYYDVENQIGGANTWANAMDSYALGEFRDDLEGAKEIGSPGYVGDAKSNVEALTAQRDALSRLRNLSDPSMTAQERFMMERARRQEERDRKSAMDAALRNLETRGMRSGGAEIAALTGAQRNTAETRMLQDLGAQANAVDRSMSALEGYGSLANTMRGQADSMSQFNRRMKADYDQWNADFRAQERDSRLGRSEKVYDARNQFTGSMYDRDRDRIDAKERGIKTRAVSNWQGSAATGDALKVMMGDEAVRRGEKLLEDEDDGLLGLGIGPL